MYLCTIIIHIYSDFFLSLLINRYYFLFLQSIKDWMLSLIVLVFVLVDLIILVTYTIVVGLVRSEDLGAKEIINAENPRQVEGVYIIVNFALILGITIADC